jgi:hypothetical protein
VLSVGRERWVQSRAQACAAPSGAPFAAARSVCRSFARQSARAAVLLSNMLAVGWWAVPRSAARIGDPRLSLCRPAAVGWDWRDRESRPSPYPAKSLGRDFSPTLFPTAYPRSNPGFPFQLKVDREEDPL